VAFGLWKQEAIAGNPIAHVKAGEIQPQGGTWFTPDSYKLSDGADAGFSQVLQLAALQPEWFPEGNICFEVDVATAKGTMEAHPPGPRWGRQPLPPMTACSRRCGSRVPPATPSA